MAGENGPVEVKVSCQCPGKPHDTDTIYLYAKPTFDMGMAALSALRESGRLVGDTDGALLSVIVRYGVAAWTCRNDDGIIRVTPDAVAMRLEWSADAVEVAREAKRLYWDAVIAPLLPAKSDSEQVSQEV